MGAKSITEIRWPKEYWVLEPLPDDIDDALNEACGGDETDTEAFAAFFREFAWSFTGEYYTADEVYEMANTSVSGRTYDSWAAVATEWIEDDTGRVDMERAMMRAADPEQETVIKLVIDQIGQSIAENDERYFWYETGLLVNGRIYCFTKPA